MWKRARALVAGGVRAALRHPAQGEQRIEPPSARSAAGGARHQLESAESLAPSLHALKRAPAATQQSARGHRAGALRFYLGTLAYTALLSGAATRLGLKGEFEGNS